MGFHLALEDGRRGEFIYSEPDHTTQVDAVAPPGGVVVGVPLDAKLKNDLPAITSKLNACTQCVHLVNPHNPTGTVSDTAPFKRFVRETAKRITAIVHESYLKFEPDFAERSAIDLRRADENVVVFRTFAKIYALAGLTIGYAIPPRPLPAALLREGIGLPHSLDQLSIAAAPANLDDDGFVTATRLKVMAEREKWNRLFRELNVRHANTCGNFAFFETGLSHQEVDGVLHDQGKAHAITRLAPE